jgi:hypothetical protein
MNRVFFCVPLFTHAALCGCNPQAAAMNESVEATHDEGGRYAGIGTYQADSVWNDIEGAAATNDAELAGQRDDSQIIIVTNRHTGEIRQCGNYSGFCIVMNPWKGESRANAPQSPVRIDRHPEEAVGAQAAKAVQSAQQAAKIGEKD